MAGDAEFIAGSRKLSNVNIKKSFFFASSEAFAIDAVLLNFITEDAFGGV